MKEVEEEVLTPVEKIERGLEYHYRYSFENQNNRNSYMGKDENGVQYTIENLTAKSPQITVHRSAGMTLSFLMLLGESKNKRATLEDLFNPEKMLEEKQTKFREIVTRAEKFKDRELDDPNNEDSRWFAENLFNALHTGKQMIDELANEIDFTDDQFLFSDTVFKICAISHYMHDVWQELCRFKNLKNEYVRKMHPELKTYDECYNYLSELYGPFTSIRDNIFNISNIHNTYKTTGEFDGRIGMYTVGTLVNKYIKEAMLDWKQNGNGKGITDYLVEKDVSFKIQKANGDVEDALMDFMDDVTYTTKMYPLFDKMLIEGTLFENTEIRPGEKRTDPTIITNIPKADTKNLKFIIPKAKVKKADKKTLKDTKKKTTKETEKKIEPKAKKKKPITIKNGLGEDIDVNEIEKYLNVLKYDANQIRGIFYDSPEYMRFYEAIDVVMGAVREIKRNNGRIILNENEPYENYWKAVEYLKECAQDYEDYKLCERTENKRLEPDKKLVNSDDKAKLDLVRKVKTRIRYFVKEAPAKKSNKENILNDNNIEDISIDVELTNEEFLKKTDEAIARLENGKYTSRKQYLQDAGYAVFGQMYRVNDSKPPHDAKTGEEISLWQHLQNKLQSGELQRALERSHDPLKLMSPGKVAALAQNEEKLKRLIIKFDKYNKIPVEEIKKNALAFTFDLSEMAYGQAAFYNENVFDVEEDLIVSNEYEDLKKDVKEWHNVVNSLESSFDDIKSSFTNTYNKMKEFVKTHKSGDEHDRVVDLLNNMQIVKDNIEFIEPYMDIETPEGRIGAKKMTDIANSLGAPYNKVVGLKQLSKDMPEEEFVKVSKTLEEVTNAIKKEKNLIQRKYYNGLKLKDGVLANANLGFQSRSNLVPATKKASKRDLDERLRVMSTVAAYQFFIDELDRTDGWSKCATKYKAEQVIKGFREVRDEFMKSPAMLNIYKKSTMHNIKENFAKEATRLGVYQEMKNKAMPKNIQKIMDDAVAKKTAKAPGMK